MFLYDTDLWKSDIDKVLEILPELDQIAGKSVLITGAAGLVCSAVVDIIFRYNDNHDKKIKILAAGRWQEEMYDRFHDMIDRDDFTFVPYDASKIDNDINVHVDYIIHGASNASPDMIVKEPVETMLSNFMGMKFLLDLAVDNGTKRLLYISTSEVYGKKDNNYPFKENEYGFIDLLNPRNSYSVGKRASETLCTSYTSEYGVDSVIVRPGHIYGPTASPRDNRVSSVWSYLAARNNSIIMKSDGAQLRSYCYCLDCASAIIKVLLKGKYNTAYNISNPNSIITIKDLARMIAKAGGVELKMEVPTEKERNSFNPMTNSSLNSDALLNLGWKGLFDAETGIVHTIELLKEVL